MSSKYDHSVYLLDALKLAEIKRGFCAPNPSVGAVIVDEDGTILSTGYHLGPGFPHAEIDALNKLKSSNLKNATIYITLEPCCHTGRTPPCTDAIVRAGIKKVVYAFQDPNPIVSGRSQKILQAAGIDCQHISNAEIDNFYKSYSYWHQFKLPFITAKIAMTLDGKIAGKDSSSLKITCDEMNKFTHQNRKHHDAILTTIKTIELDDPQLNVREEDEVISKPLYILDRKLRLSTQAKIFSTAHSITVFHANDIDQGSRLALIDAGVRCIQINEIDNLLDMKEVIKLIGEDGIHDLWVEAGRKCFMQFTNEKLLQRSFIYISPHCNDEGIDLFSDNIKFDLRDKKNHWQQVGQDVFLETIW